MPKFRHATVPPTLGQLDAFRKHLKACLYVETAAQLAGVPRKTFLDWVRLGRKDHPDFVPVVRIIDEETSELSQRVLGPIQAAAFEEGNLSALQFLYKIRLAESEKRFYQKLYDAEDAAEQRDASDGIGEDDLAAAEARAMEQLEKMAEEVH